MANIETRTRTLVKTVIYRLYCLFLTFVVLLMFGQTMEKAFDSSILLNVLLLISYYINDRIWLKIKWGTN
jgi:hypothetical protein